MMYDVAHLQNDKHYKGKSWGWIPPTQEVYDAFHYVKDVVNPMTMLEIGFYKGHSTSYWAQTLPNCSIVSCAPPHNNFIKYGAIVKDKYPNIVDMFPYKSPQIWDEFHIRNGSQRRKQGHKKRYTQFDFVFIDGDHSFQSALLDTVMAVDILHAKWVMFDNHDQETVREAIECYGKLKLEKVFPYTCDMYERGTENKTISNLELALYCRV